MKLSKTQMEVLKELKRLNSYLIFMPYRGFVCTIPYYFIHDSLERVRYGTVHKLLKDGYLKGGKDRDTFYITEEGIALLNDIKS